MIAQRRLPPGRCRRSSRRCSCRRRRRAAPSACRRSRPPAGAASRARSGRRPRRRGLLQTGLLRTSANATTAPANAIAAATSRARSKPAMKTRRGPLQAASCAEQWRPSSAIPTEPPTCRIAFRTKPTRTFSDRNRARRSRRGRRHRQRHAEAADDSTRSAACDTELRGRRAAPQQGHAARHQPREP